MSNVKSMEEVTYFSEDSGAWGYYGCESDVYETQKDAYDAYKMNECDECDE